MISQASSESSICFVVPAVEAKDAVRALRDAFSFELTSGLIDAVEARREIALVAVVGLGMAGTPGIAARVFSSLSRERINIVAIAQGSSELNITVAVEQKQARDAVVALHREFQLDKIRPLASNDGRDATLALLGYGQIGRALAGQLGAQQRYFAQDLGIVVRCVGVTDRKGLVLDEAGFTHRKRWRSFVAAQDARQVARARGIVGALVVIAGAAADLGRRHCGRNISVVAASGVARIQCRRGK